VHEAEQTLDDVRALWRALFRNPFDEARESGITGPQVRVMACLVSNGPMPLTQLSKILDMSHSTASGIVDRLEARGLLRRSQDATDRRRTTIEVMPSVTRYVRELEAGPAGRLATVLEAASSDQRRAIRRGLKTLRKLVGESDAR
jgi:DNA-binding MarR family transcriptional regulator